MDVLQYVKKPIGAFGKCADASTYDTFCQNTAHLHVPYVSPKIESGIIIPTKLGDLLLDVLN